MHICTNCMMGILIALPFVGGAIKWVYLKAHKRFPKKLPQERPVSE